MMEEPCEDQCRRAVEVLVVDDHREITELVAETLHDEGYAVRVAHDGVSALRAVRAQRPGLLLLDVAMPALTGDQVLQHLRSEGYHDLPIILMTADRSPERYSALGPNRLLRKPFDLDQLVRAVGECVARAALPGYAPRLQARELGA
jgi:two-component system response regulator MprA